jgi:hypothetical protein
MTAKQELEQAIQANMAKGMRRDQACKAAFKADSTLQQRVIDEANHPLRSAAKASD